MHGLPEAIAHLNAWLVAIYAVLTALDVWTTSQFPKYGITEANGILRRLMSLHGFDELFLAKHIGFLALFVLAGEGLLRPVALIGICIMQAGIVVWNLYQIVRRRRATTTEIP